MVLPLLIAGAGMLASGIGNSIGARSFANQQRKEAARDEAMTEERRQSIRQALTEAGPAAQYDRTHAEAQAFRGQQDTNQAIGRAYGTDNPALADAIAANGQTINDRAWTRGFRVNGRAVNNALMDDTSRQRRVDSEHAWWEAFLQNRLQRAGSKGEALRFLGKIATAYGLGAANMGMAAPADDGSGGQVGDMGYGTYGPPAPAARPSMGSPHAYPIDASYGIN